MQCRSLVKALLCTKSKRRLSAMQVLDHAWMKDAADKVRGEILTIRLQNLRSRRKLRSGVRVLLAVMRMIEVMEDARKRRESVVEGEGMLSFYFFFLFYFVCFFCFFSFDDRRKWWRRKLRVVFSFVSLSLYVCAIVEGGNKSRNPSVSVTVTKHCRDDTLEVVKRRSKSRPPPPIDEVLSSKSREGKLKRRPLPPTPGMPFPSFSETSFCRHPPSLAQNQWHSNYVACTRPIGKVNQVTTGATMEESKHDPQENNETQPGKEVVDNLLSAASNYDEAPEKSVRPLPLSPSFCGERNKTKKHSTSGQFLAWEKWHIKWWNIENLKKKLHIYAKESRIIRVSQAIYGSKKTNCLLLTTLSTFSFYHFAKN